MDKFKSVGHVTNYFNFSRPTARMSDLRIFIHSHSRPLVRGSFLRAFSALNRSFSFGTSSIVGKRSLHSGICSRKTVWISLIRGLASYEAAEWP